MDTEGQETIQPKKADDGFIALVILVIALVVGVILLINYFRSSRSSQRAKLQAGSSFTAPPERAAYLEAKENADLSNPAELDEIKKLLMKRAMKAIPIVLSLQNEGSSIERLYKKGMLTDDMHFKVKELKDFVDAEFQAVQAEADELVEGWGQMIWPQAMQFHQMVQKQTDGKGNGKEEEEEKKKEQQPKPKKESKKVEPKEVKEPVKDVLPTSDEAKALEAEKNAQKLLEEEEKEKQKSSKKSGKSSKSNKKN